MQATRRILIGIILTFSAGCDARLLSPRWHLLQERGVSYVPGDYQYAQFIHGDATDEIFAAAVDDLKKTRVKELNLQHTQLTDESIDSLLELERLETLFVNGTDFTLDGVIRLKALPRLKRLYVAEGQFTPAEQERIRTALPNTELGETPWGAYRYAGRGEAKEPE